MSWIPKEDHATAFVFFSFVVPPIFLFIAVIAESL